VPLPEAAGPSMAMIIASRVPWLPALRSALRAGRRGCRDGKPVSLIEHIAR
jgi:hypothetical protein